MTTRAAHDAPSCVPSAVNGGCPDQNPSLWSTYKSAGCFNNETPRPGKRAGVQVLRLDHSLADQFFFTGSANGANPSLVPGNMASLSECETACSQNRSPMLSFKDQVCQCWDTVYFDQATTCDVGLPVSPFLALSGLLADLKIFLLRTGLLPTQSRSVHLRHHPSNVRRTCGGLLWNWSVFRLASGDSQPAHNLFTIVPVRLRVRHGHLSDPASRHVGRQVPTLRVLPAFGLSVIFLARSPSDICDV